MVKLFTQNKKVLMLAIGIGLILSLAPFYFVEAAPGIAEFCGCTGIESINPVCWLECAAGAIFSLPIRIIFFVIVGILGIGALIAGLIYAITVVLVNWVIEIIMSVGIVPGNPLTPTIVDIGWTFSRQFANMFFVLALAFIGLATILKIREYEAKKALPTLIIIALLINFTPVIVGFVVDMGNLVTKFFLDRTGSISILGDIMNTAGNYLLTSIRDIFTKDGQFLEPDHFFEIMGTFLGITIYGLVLLVFFFLAGFIYLLIGAVFFCRTVILWVLMILSPIAFLSKVFPNTKTTKMVFPDILHWDKWWEKLIQWTIIGIPIGFFLYLSNSVLLAAGDFADKFGVGKLETRLGVMANQIELGNASTSAQLSTALIGNFIPLFVSLLAPTISLMLLIMGTLISFKAAPEGAKGIMRFTTEKGIPQTIRGIKVAGREFTDIRQKYQAYRDFGLSRSRATGEIAKRFWQRRIQPAIAPSAAPIKIQGKTVVPGGRRARVVRGIRGVYTTGIFKAIQDTAMAQVKKELKVHTKTCPSCGETNIPAKEKFCHACGQPLS
jgi:hypothetical protein